MQPGMMGYFHLGVMTGEMLVGFIVLLTVYGRKKQQFMSYLKLSFSDRELCNGISFISRA